MNRVNVNDKIWKMSWQVWWPLTAQPASSTMGRALIFLSNVLSDDKKSHQDKWEHQTYHYHHQSMSCLICWNNKWSHLFALAQHRACCTLHCGQFTYLGAALRDSSLFVWETWTLHIVHHCFYSTMWWEYMFFRYVFHLLFFSPPFS